MHFFHTRRSAGRAAVAGVVAAISLASLAGAAQAQVVSGTVVHLNGRAHSFVVANRSGALFAIHAPRSPRAGSKVVVTTRRLRNGTFAAQRVRVLGHNLRARVRLHGTVSYVNAQRGVFVLSARGVSMLVRSARGQARMADALPSVGTVVTVTGTVDDQGDLQDESLQVDGTDTNGIDLEGTILAIDTTARTLTVSADDNDQSGLSVTVTVPESLDISLFAVGEEVELQVLPQGNGYALLGSASDEGVQGADDQAEEQGDQGDDDQGENQGENQQQPGTQGGTE